MKPVCWDRAPESTHYCPIVQRIGCLITDQEIRVQILLGQHIGWYGEMVDARVLETRERELVQVRVLVPAQVKPPW